MAVAKKQIQELLTIIRAFIPEEKVLSFLTRLLVETEASRKNRSFSETIERLREAWLEHEAERKKSL